MSIDQSSPFVMRFKAWLDERFPFANALAFFLFYLTAAVVADFESGGASLGWSDLVSCLVVWAFFLLLRVFDEHKDYEEDALNHPDRVLQRGLITLAHLKIVGAICFAVTLLWSLLRDGGVSHTTLAWAVMMAWACLMAVEFFCREWLSARLTVYALSHMAVMPMVAWWCMNLSTSAPPVTENTILVAALFFSSGLAFEIARKTRGPEEERETVDSYSKIFGTKGSAAVVLAIALVVLALLARLIANLQGEFHWLGFLPLVLGAALTVAMLLKFMAAPSAKGRKMNEASLGLLAILGYGAVIGNIAFVQGLAWF